LYPRYRQIEGAARAALSRPRKRAEQVSRLRHPAALSKLAPDFAEKFLSFVIDEVVRQHETVPRGTA
jgi:chorismate mutase